MMMNNPCHPGEIIREDMINELGLEVTEAVRALQVNRAPLPRLLNQKAGLSPERAIRIERLVQMQII